MDSGSFLQSGWGALASGLITAVVVIGVARWNQPSHKAKWESVKTQQEVLDGLPEDDPMRTWMTSYIQVEMRRHARTAVGVGLAVWQWVIIVLIALAAGYVLVNGVILYLDMNEPLADDTVGASLCLERGISDCTIAALEPERTEDVRNRIYINAIAFVAFPIGVFTFFRAVNNPLTGKSHLGRVPIGNRRARESNALLARMFADLPPLTEGADSEPCSNEIAETEAPPDEATWSD